MSILKSRLRSICLQTIDEYGWNAFDDIDVSTEKAENIATPIAAYLTLDDRQIHICVAEDIETTARMFLQHYKLETSYHKFEKIILRMLIRHEHGHHQICPRTKEGFETIIQGSYEAVRTRVYSEQEAQMMCSNVHNLLSDTILNTVSSRSGREPKEFAEAYALLQLYSAWHSREISLKQKGLAKLLGPLAKPRIDEMMTVFAFSNMILCGSPEELQEKLRPLSKWIFPGRGRYLQEIITILSGDKDTSQMILDGTLPKEEWSAFLDRIKDESFWWQMGYDYAELTWLLQKRKYNETSSSYTDPKSKGKGEGSSKKESSSNKDQKGKSSGNQPGDKGQGDDGEEDKKKDKASSGKDEEKKSKGNENKESGSKENKKEDSNPTKEAINKIREEKSFTHNLMKQFPRLDRLYRNRAGQLALTSEDQNAGMGYSYMISKEQIDLSEFNHKQMDWASSRIYHQGSNKVFELYKRETPLDLNVPIENISTGIPDLAFVFDSSVSMGFDPIAGTGQYHYALLAFYSILQFLESQNLAHLIKYLGMNFSYKTVSSDWCSYREVSQVKKALFCYQAGGTFLDVDTFSSIRKERTDNCIVFMLSDTFLNFDSNINEVVEEIKLIQRDSGIGFYLFQMGPLSPLAMKCEKMGVPVHKVNSAKDFMDKSISFTKDLYGELV